MNHYRFNDIFVGMKESFTAVMDEERFDAFRALTGDENPLHCDREYAMSHGYPDRICYGMLTASLLSTLAGVYLPGQRSLIHSVAVNMTKPVILNDVLTVEGIVKDMDETFRFIHIKVNIFNQHGEKVMRGKMIVGVSE
jgi:3-hydroxybutyryl-CoA dehydratase